MSSTYTFTKSTRFSENRQYNPTSNSHCVNPNSVRYSCSVSVSYQIREAYLNPYSPFSSKHTRPVPSWKYDGYSMSIVTSLSFPFKKGRYSVHMFAFKAKEQSKNQDQSDRLKSHNRRICLCIVDTISLLEPVNCQSRFKAIHLTFFIAFYFQHPF